MVARALLFHARAREMRHAPTPSEDAALAAMRATIDLDDEPHARRREVSDVEAKRDARLARAGWRVVRVGSEEAVEEMVAVIAAVVRA